MKKKPLLLLLCALLVVSLVLAACGTQGDEPGGDGPAVDDGVVDDPAARKVATFIWTQEPDSLNPMYTTMWFSVITQQIWNCDAWDYDVNNLPHPVLVTELPSAENGGISEDGTTLTFTLRDDIVWSDGEPITSADFLFTA
jgi:peptide/nickel transport system substrate-binding protein